MLALRSNVFFATVLGGLFFPADMPDWLRQLQTFGIFAAGYLARPLGGEMPGAWVPRLAVRPRGPVRRHHCNGADRRRAGLSGAGALLGAVFCLQHVLSVPCSG